MMLTRQEREEIQKIVHDDIKTRCKELIQIMIDMGYKSATIDPGGDGYIYVKPQSIEATGDNHFSYDAKTDSLDPNGDSLEQMQRHLRIGHKKLRKQLRKRDRGDARMLKRCLKRIPAPFLTPPNPLKRAGLAIVITASIIHLLWTLKTWMQG